MIKVLIAEDSDVVRDALVYVLDSDSEIDVVGVAENGLEAVRAAAHLAPDVITMDIHMPQMNGFDATRKIMETCPVPIVIVSGSTAHDEVTTTFQALESGALAVVQRPTDPGHPDFEKTAAELVKVVKTMSEVKVVKRWPRQAARQIAHQGKENVRSGHPPVRIIAIGASTGGPVAIETILKRLPGHFPVPLVIVQHIASGFHQGLAEWLTQSGRIPVHIPADGEKLQPGHAYIAPDGYHLGVTAGGRVRLSGEIAENGIRPSISHLFRSVAQAYGNSAVGILLTGMGRDGADGLHEMRQCGAVTIVQNEKSSVVFGMAREALRLNAATCTLSPEEIAEVLTEMTT